MNMYPKFELKGDSWVTFLPVTPHLPLIKYEEKIAVIYSPEGEPIPKMLEKDIGRVKWISENLRDILVNALDSIYEHYLEVKKEYGYYFKNLEEVPFPNVNNANELAPMLALSVIFVHAMDINDKPVFGLAFNCDWDEEHGLAVVMNGSSVLEVGDGSCAFLLWVAEQYQTKT